MVSIIVPIYNVENYLERCIKSLINQTLKEIEIILVNDGSKDSSGEIMLELSNQDSRIKIFTKENGGLSDARNFGIKKASGDYLAFVDSDDWIQEDMMEKMYNLAKDSSCDIVICNLQKVNEKGVPFRKLPQMTTINQKIIIDLEDDFSPFGELSWFACNKLFKQELFIETEFTKNLHFEDIATVPRLFLKSKKIGFIPDYFYNYFEREGSITRNFTKKGLDMFEAIKIVEKEFIKSKFVDQNDIWKNFVILNGFYSFLAYLARVKDNSLKKEMYFKLEKLLQKTKIKRKEILYYKRFNENYIINLSLLKKIYYLFQLFKINT